MSDQHLQHMVQSWAAGSGGAGLTAQDIWDESTIQQIKAIPDIYRPVDDSAYDPCMVPDWVKGVGVTYGDNQVAVAADNGMYLVYWLFEGQE